MVAIPWITKRTKDPLKELERQQARERAEMDKRQKRERLALEETMRKEAVYYQKLVVSTLSRLGLYHVSSTRNTVDVVHVERVVSTPEAHYILVDTTRLPTGTTITRMAHDDALLNLQYACRRMVHCEHTPDRGFWYIIERTGGVHGVPTEYDYKTALENDLPKKARPLSFIVGTGRNKRTIHTDLAKAPHILVAGSTNMGKSVFVNNIICTLAKRNDPGRVQFVMIDLKGGVELAVYAKLPHLTRPIVAEPEDALTVFDELLDETARRMEMFKGTAKNIESWNAHRQKGVLPYIVLVIDEMAMLMLNRDRIGRQTVGSEANNKLSKLAAVCRAAGIHIVAATQRPSVDVITGLIKANFPVRIGFACADNAQSMTILDNGLAAGLLMQGRLIFHKSNEYTELQAPLVTEELAEEIVNDLANNRAVELYPVTRAEVARYAIANLTKKDDNGEPVPDADGAIRHWLPAGKLWKAFDERCSRRDMERLLQKMQDDGSFSLDGQEYKVFPGAMPKPSYFTFHFPLSTDFAEGVPLATEMEATPDDPTSVHARADAQDQLEEDQDIDGDKLLSFDMQVSELPDEGSE